MLVIVDEHARECLAIDVARKLTSEDLLERLSALFICRGVPDYVRSDNGPEFRAHRVRDWLETVEVKTLFIEPGSPWENGYVPSQADLFLPFFRLAGRHNNPVSQVGIFSFEC